LLQIITTPALILTIVGLAPGHSAPQLASSTITFLLSEKERTRQPHHTHTQIWKRLQMFSFTFALSTTGQMPALVLLETEHFFSSAFVDVYLKRDDAANEIGDIVQGSI
jgi:hypothetical protein